MPRSADRSSGVSEVLKSYISAVRDAQREPLELKTLQETNLSRARPGTRFCPKNTWGDDFLPSAQGTGGMNGAICNQRSKLPKFIRARHGLIAVGGWGMAVSTAIVRGSRRAAARCLSSPPARRQSWNR